MSKVLYFLATFAESGLSVFGIRSTYQQPAYSVVQTIAPDVELRAYAPRTVVETDIEGGDRGQAFGRLFRYITGANTGAHLVAMTVPVEQTPDAIAMTVPVETAPDTQVMRFFLPPSVVASGAPQPTEHGVRIATIPAETLAVIRYSGSVSDGRQARQTARLRAAVMKAGLTVVGQPMYFGYDPPFSIPLFRRNEVALAVK